MDSYFLTNSEFAIAAAIFNYGGKSIGPEIGKLKFVIKSWEATVDLLKWRELDSRPCLQNDFASVDEFKSEYGFYEMDQSTEAIMKSSNYELLCIED